VFRNTECQEYRIEILEDILFLMSYFLLLTIEPHSKKLLHIRYRVIFRVEYCKDKNRKGTLPVIPFL
jgi:hypothetical protein